MNSLVVVHLRSHYASCLDFVEVISLWWLSDAIRSLVASRIVHMSGKIYTCVPFPSCSYIIVDPINFLLLIQYIVLFWFLSSSLLNFCFSMCSLYIEFYFGSTIKRNFRFWREWLNHCMAVCSSHSTVWEQLLYLLFIHSFILQLYSCSGCDNLSFFLWC